MHAAVEPLKRTLELNARLFRNALDGVSEEKALERPNAGTNHMAFLGCHLVEARHYLAGALGLPTVSPFKDILEKARGIEDVAEFPSLDAIRQAFDDVTRQLSGHLDGLTDADLAAKAEYRFPIEGGDTRLGALSFLVQHDSYHLGQLALLRRYLGYEAMSYR